MKCYVHILFLTIFLSISVNSQQLNQNQVAIRNDRVILLNGQPFFPIGMCCESEYYYYQLKNNGFNFINLWSQNHFLYSDSCGFNSKNVISGDVTTNVPYNEMLIKYAPDLRWDENARRIFNYIKNDKFYVIADDYTFYPNDNDSYIINLGSCGDSIIFNQRFDQITRNSAVDRLANISNWQGNRLIGAYVKDDANMFEVGNPDKMYYYNTYFNTRVNNFRDTYNRFKQEYPNSIVILSLPACYFPRAMNPQLWTNTNLACEAWISDALKFLPSCDVLWVPGGLTSEWIDTAWTIYSNTYPSVYPYHLEHTIFGRLIGNNKAVLGGMTFDTYESLPHWDDPAFLTKLKWAIYVSLEKGCTGLMFFGWHKLARPDGQLQVKAWNYIQSIIHEMVIQLHLDNKVFTKTNSGQTGHTITGSYSNNVSYAVYKIDGWNDYYILVTNNPNGSLFATEPQNAISISCDRNIIDWTNKSITEVFSNQNLQASPEMSIHYTMPAFGTALFHIQPLINQIPENFYLSQNYPNPFNPSTLIKFGIPGTGFTKLSIYDLTGRLVKTLVNGNLQAGTYEYSFDASNVASGIYYYELRYGNYVASKSMIVLK
jgi:hypothetical protein